MKQFKILIDSCSDVTQEFIEKNNVPFVTLLCTLNDTTFTDDFGKSYNHKSFYDEVRKGAMPTTTQVNTYTFEETFRKYVSEGYAILYIAFSSALSGTHNSALIAREAILEEYKDADITVVDSRSASMGEGLIVYYAYEMMKNGASKDEIVSWIESNKLKINHWITVHDLNHLKRGGRLSSTSAMIGTLLDIKPILYINDEGKLLPVTKVKGRKKSIKTLAEKLKENITNPENQIIGISHADCLEDAELLKKLISDEVKVKDFIISNIGTIVGSHAGPGTLAVFFIGKNRNV